MMKPSGRIGIVTAWLFLCFFNPDTLFSQWVADVAYRYGVNTHTVSPQELSPLLLQNSYAKPYTLGGYKVTAGYKFRPDSMKTAFQTGLSYWKSRSGTMMYTTDSVNTAYTWMKHEMITLDLGVSVEYSIRSMAASTGLTVLFPFYTRGSENKVTAANIEQVSQIQYSNYPGISIQQEIALWTKGSTSLFAGLSAGWMQVKRKSRVLIASDGSIPLSKKELHYLTENQIQKKGLINDPSLSGFDSSKPTETQTYNEPLTFVSLKLGLLFSIR